MNTKVNTTRRRGRPPKNPEGRPETRALLMRAGLETLTERGFSATGIDQILRRVDVPKGSFYHYFDSKEAFGAELITQYDNYFKRKLRLHLEDSSRSPIARLRDFCADAQAGMARHSYRRGCLIGNLGQEIGALPESFREQLMQVFSAWQAQIAACLVKAQKAGEISEHSDCEQLAAFFWIGWEGAVLRAKLERSPVALEIFADGFFASITLK